ncbi:hypothetical protein ACFW42_08430 [Streptomyces albidoflavus]
MAPAWHLRPATAADVGPVAELRAVVLRADLTRGLLERCDRDAVRVRLNVLSGSPARRLYERHGFTLESEDAVDVFLVREPGPPPVQPDASRRSSMQKTLS